MVPITSDAIVESSETFTVSLSGLTGTTAVNTASIGTVTITDNDSAELRFEDEEFVDETAAFARVEVTLNGVVPGGFRVTASTTGETATAGVDYTETTTELTFAGTSDEIQTFMVPIIDDNDIEDTETFRVSLSGLTVTTNVDISDTISVLLVSNETSLTVTPNDLSESAWDDGSEVLNLRLSGINFSGGERDGDSWENDSARSIVVAAPFPAPAVT